MLLAARREIPNAAARVRYQTPKKLYPRRPCVLACPLTVAFEGFANDLRPSDVSPLGDFVDRAGESFRKAYGGESHLRSV
jgi:hypothetical protein